MAQQQTESKYAQEAGIFLNIMDEMAPQIGLDYSVESIQRLENFVAENFDPPGSKQVGESLIVGIGCYVGEVIIRELGGHWNEEDKPEINDVGAVKAVFPVEKARKRFENGPEESLAWYYHSVVRNAAIAAQAAPSKPAEGVLDKLFGFFKK